MIPSKPINDKTLLLADTSSSFDNDDDNADSEFEVHTDPRGDDYDDSISADDDIADEDEVNSLMRESEMSLSELLSKYGLPNTGNKQDTNTSKEDSSPLQGNTHSTRKRRLIGNSELVSAVSSSANGSPESCTGADAIDGSSSLKVVVTHSKSSPCRPSRPPHSKTSSSDIATTNQPSKQSTFPSTICSSTLSDFKLDTVTTLSLQLDISRPESDQHSSVVSDTKAKSFDSGRASDELEKDNKEDTDEVDEEEECEDDEIDASGSCSPRIWSHALTGAENLSAYNSDEDEDYHPTIEGDGDWRGEIRVGDDFQASVPPNTIVPDMQAQNSSHLGSDCKLVWDPSSLTEAEIIHYQQAYSRTLSVAVSTPRTYDDEEALFLLMQCDFGSYEALQQAEIRQAPSYEVTRYFEAWTEADCSAFERGFLTFNKNFRQIQQSKLRHKTVADLVQFYYLWKKTARHDDFIRFYRREKRKPLHPGITDFMDCLLQEQYLYAESLARTQSPDAISSSAASMSSELGRGCGSDPPLSRSTEVDVLLPKSTNTVNPNSGCLHEVGGHHVVNIPPHLRIPDSPQTLHNLGGHAHTSLLTSVSQLES